MEWDILVDGYNVIKNNLMFRSLEYRNLAEARNLLIRQLKNRYRSTCHRVIVVFDGNGADEQVSHDDHIRIVYTRYGETADSVIVRLVAEARQAGRHVEMYSDDGEIRASVIEQKGSVQTTRQLMTQLNAAPRDVAQRSSHRQAMRRLYGLDPAYKDEDEQNDMPHQSRRRRKGKARHHRHHKH
jgi:predicted RNA-binding protein with PIN domain